MQPPRLRWSGRCRQAANHRGLRRLLRGVAAGALTPADEFLCGTSDLIGSNSERSCVAGCKLRPFHGGRSDGTVEHQPRGPEPQPLPPDATINLVALNPQPLPPDATIELVALNPQPLPPEVTINLVALNPQPIPPGVQIKLVDLNPQPLPPKATINFVGLNPQPLPPNGTLEFVSVAAWLAD
jgi:hypothetical protein